MNRPEILDTAKACVCGQREQDYGTPEDNFRLIASLWEPYLKARCVSGEAEVCIRPEDVATMMALLKIARIAHCGFGVIRIRKTTVNIMELSTRNVIVYGKCRALAAQGVHLGVNLSKNCN